MAPSLRAFVPAAVRKAGRRLMARQVDRRLDSDLTRIAAGRDLVVAGPWLGEVGFELLYWIPFLAWCAETYGIPRERWLVISRGGTAGWYQHIAAHYGDVFDQVTPDEYRSQHDARVRDLGEQKQTRVTAFDQRLVEGALRSVTEAAPGNATHGWAHLHPSRMYELMSPYWWEHESSAWVHRHVSWRRLTAVRTDAGVVPHAPAAPYVAVKFYFNDCFPASPENRAFVRAVVTRLAALGPVVNLSTGLRLDDHGAFPLELPGVSHLPADLEPSRNLGVQDAIVAGARAFVGTYGGFSYLAPFHGVPSFAFYSHRPGFSDKHLVLAREAFDRLPQRAGTGTPLMVQDASVLTPDGALAPLTQVHG